MIKTEWRTKMKKLLKQQSEDERKENMQLLYESLFSNPVWKSAHIVAVTVSAGDEINTRPIIERAWQEGKTTAVPKCIPDRRELQFYKLTDYRQLEDSFYGLMEPDPGKCSAVLPSELDLVIVPGIAFDRSGYRIGYGGGYYDRFLQGRGLKTLSLCHQFQLVDKLPAEEHDIPVEMIITPHETMSTQHLT